MKSFKDSEGGEWPLSINVSAIKRVRDLLQIDLSDPMAGTPPAMTRLASEILLLVDVIYALCKPEAEKRDITDEQFGTRLGGMAIDQAVEAFWLELSDFFRSLRRLEVVQAIEGQRNLTAATIKAGVAKLEEAEASMARHLAKAVSEINVDAIVQEAYSPSATDSPAS